MDESVAMWREKGLTRSCPTDVLVSSDLSACGMFRGVPIAKTAAARPLHLPVPALLPLLQPTESIGVEDSVPLGPCPVQPLSEGPDQHLTPPPPPPPPPRFARNAGASRQGRSALMIGTGSQASSASRQVLVVRIPVDSERIPIARSGANRSLPFGPCGPGSPRAPVSPGGPCVPAAHGGPPTDHGRFGMHDGGFGRDSGAMAIPPGRGDGRTPRHRGVSGRPSFAEGRGARRWRWPAGTLGRVLPAGRRSRLRVLCAMPIAHARQSLCGLHAG